MPRAGGVEDTAVLGGSRGAIVSWAGWQRAAAFSSQDQQGLRRRSLKGALLGALEEGEWLVPGRWAAVGVCSACCCLWLPVCKLQAGPMQIKA